MKATAWRRTEADTSWLPGRRWTRLRCAVRGHRWSSSPTAAGAVVIMCDGCRELIHAPFVDQDVLGLPARQGRSLMGTTSGGRVAVDLTAAVLDGDGPAVRRLRREATAQPGVSVDALALLAALLSGMSDPDRPLAALRVVADAAERHALDAELQERHEGATP